MTHFTTLHHMVALQAPAATVMMSPGGMPLSYGAMNQLIAQTTAALNAMGIGRGDRVGNKIK